MIVEDPPLLAVIYDLGSATPFELIGAARSVCRLVFVCDRERPHVAAVLPHIERIGHVLDVTGMSIDEAARGLERLGCKGILTFSEYRIRVTAALAAASGLPFPTTEVAERLTDKFAQRERLRHTGVQTTRCMLVRTPEEAAAAAADIAGPVVVKPRCGAGSIDTALAGTAGHAAELVRLFSDAEAPREFVVEEYLEGDAKIAGGAWGDYVSVESIVQSGAVTTVAVTGKFPLAPPFRETGMFLPSHVPTAIQRDAAELASAAIHSLGLTQGVVHTEIKFTRQGLRIIEVNGRLGGHIADLLRRSAGVDILRLAMLVALERRIEVGPLDYGRIAFQYFILPGDGGAAPLDLEKLRTVPGVRRLAPNDVADKSGWHAWQARHGLRRCAGHGHAKRHPSNDRRVFGQALIGVPPVAG